MSHLDSKTSPAFLFYAGDKEKYVALLRERYPANVAETLRRAESICQHRFRVLGADFKFAGEIDWHLDPESGRRWPRDYFEKIDRWMWSERRLGDYKLPWELNRHQYFITLGKAYWLTGDERYAEEFAQQVLSWIRHNPLGIGINWYSALEIGVRLISWALAFQFFRGCSGFRAEASKPFLKSLYQQARFLRDHLTPDWEVRNNHIVGEVSALILVGSLFPEFKEADEWLRTGLRVFEQELCLQTFWDGVNKEQAVGYHRFVLDFLLLVVVLARRGALPLSPDLDKLAEKMLNYLMHLTTPQSDAPAVGDSDHGRGYILDTSADFWDSRGSLAIGSVLFHRPDFKSVAQGFPEEAFWLLGPQGLETFEQLEGAPPQQLSVAFPQAQHYVIRDGWTAGSDFAFFRCGPFGWGGDGFCAHAHCDLLSFVLYLQGSPVIVDSGTYTYHGPWRDHFRLTAAHNTVIVDGQEQAVPYGAFGWQHVPEAKCLEWMGDRVKGALGFPNQVEFHRELLHPQPGVLRVVDTFMGQGEHVLEWFFHFHPILHLEPSAEGAILASLASHGLFMIVSVPDPGMEVQIRQDWISQSYGTRQQNQVLYARWQGKLQSEQPLFHWQFARILSGTHGTHA